MGRIVRWIKCIKGYSNFDLLIREENAITPFCRFKECFLGDLITYAIKASSNTEIANVNGGSIRNNLKIHTIQLTVLFLSDKEQRRVLVALISTKHRKVYN